MSWWNPLSWFAPNRRKPCPRCGKPTIDFTPCWDCAHGTGAQLVNDVKRMQDEERAQRKLEAQQYKDRMREANRGKAG